MPPADITKRSPQFEHCLYSIDIGTGSVSVFTVQIDDTSAETSRN